MLAPAVVLLALALLVPSDWAKSVAAEILPLFAPAAGPMALPAPTAWSSAEPWLATVMMLIVAAFALFRERLPQVVAAGTDLSLGLLFRKLNHLHSGIVNDYVVWIAVGVALFASFAAA